MMLDFADCIQGKKRNPFDYKYELLVEKALMAACGDRAVDFIGYENDDGLKL